MAKTRLNEFDNPDGFRRLLLTRGSATADEIAEALGLSRASYYRLVDMFVDRLYGSEEPSPQQHQQTETPWFQEKLVALTQAHPKWGCYKLAASLSAEKQISGPTIQKALARLGLDTWEKRFARKEEILMTNRKQFLELSDAEKRLLIKNNPCLADVGLLASYRPNIEAFAANVLEVTPGAEGQHRYLLVLISLHTHVVHLEGWAAGKFSAAVIKDGKERATQWISTKTLQHHNTHLLMQSNSRPLYLRLENALLSRSAKHVSKSNIPAALRMMNKIVIKEAMRHYVEKLQVEGEVAADDYLRLWADEHNQRPRLGFPTFGKSPKEQHDTFAK